MAARLAALLLLFISTGLAWQLQGSTGSRVLTNAQAVVTVQTGQELADAMAEYGRSGIDTQIVLRPPHGQQHISLQGVNFTFLDMLPDGSLPYSKGTVTIRGETSTGGAVVWDTAMRANMTNLFTGSAKVVLDSSLILINLCEKPLKVDSNWPDLVWVTASNLGLIPRSQAYQSQYHMGPTFYLRGANVAMLLYLSMVQASPFHTVAHRALPLMATLPWLRSGLERATDDPELIGFNGSYIGAMVVNVTYKAISNTQDPVLQLMNATGLLMPPSFCGNGSVLPFTITQQEFSVTEGPLCFAGSIGRLQHCLSTVANLAGQQAALKRPVPVVMQLFNTSLTPDMLPGGVLNINGAMLLAGPVYLNPLNLQLSVLDFKGSQGTIQLAAGAQLFLQQLVLTGLKQRSIPTGLGKGMPSMVSALPLAAIRTTDSADAWSSPPAIVMHDCTLVLPDDDYLALLALAAAGTPSDVIGCLSQATHQHASSLQTGIQSLTASYIDPCFKFMVLLNLTGWGITATGLTAQPEGSTFASQLRNCRVGSTAADDQMVMSNDGGSSDMRDKLLGSVLAAVGMCALAVAVLLLLRYKRNQRLRKGAGVPAAPDAEKQQAAATCPPAHTADAVMEQVSPPQMIRSSSRASSYTRGRAGAAAYVQHLPAVGAATTMPIAAPPPSSAANNPGPLLPSLDTVNSLQHLASFVTVQTIFAPSVSSTVHAKELGSSYHSCNETNGAGGFGRNEPRTLHNRARTSNCTAADALQPVSSQDAKPLHVLKKQVHVPDAGSAPSHALLSLQGPGHILEDSGSSSERFKQLIAAKAVDIRGQADRVVLQGVLGSGGWGTVYAGEWRGLPVAVKTVVFELPSEPQGTSSLVQAEQHLTWPGSAIMETAIAASVGHRNLVSTYRYDIQPLQACHKPRAGGLQVEEAFQAEGGQGSKPGYTVFKLLLVQELCGASLAVVLDKGALINKCTGRADDFWVVCLLLDLAEGLQYLHEHNIVHGDLKPANILLKPDSTRPIGVVAKLTDFGLSCYVADASHVSNCYVGTPFYTAPEVVMHGCFSAAADMFSLGVIIWQLYTGKRPCTQDESGVYTWQADFGHFQPGQEPCQGCWDLEYRCLQHDVKLRPTAREVVQTLRATLGLPACTTMWSSAFTAAMTATTNAASDKPAEASTFLGECMTAET